MQELTDRNKYLELQNNVQGQLIRKMEADEKALAGMKFQAKPECEKQQIIIKDFKDLKLDKELVPKVAKYFKELPKFVASWEEDDVK